MQDKKMSEMIQSNGEFQQKIIMALNNSLKDMQESNERKLDKIEATVNEKLDTINRIINNSYR